MLIASGASPAIAQLLTNISVELGAQITALNGGSTFSFAVEDQAPLGTKDPRGAGLAAGSLPLIIAGIVVGLLGSDGIFKSICLSGSIIAEDSTAENQSRAIISSFHKSSQLLADWIKTTEEMFPGCNDLISLIPKPSIQSQLYYMLGLQRIHTFNFPQSIIINQVSTTNQLNLFSPEFISFKLQRPFKL
jgi:hypothetical protein